MPGTLIVVPCLDEADRLRPEEFLRLVREGSTGILFVDDGSRDATRSVLEGIRDRADGAVRIIGLERNVGKGEAVRIGLREAIGAGADCPAATGGAVATTRPRNPAAVVLPASSVASMRQ